MEHPHIHVGTTSRFVLLSLKEEQLNIEICEHGDIDTESPYVFYVGRDQLQQFYGAGRCLSALGNPFTLGDAVAHYRRWLWHKLQRHDLDILRALDILETAYQQYGKLRLVCSCTPCHGDVIKACLEERHS